MQNFVYPASDLDKARALVRVLGSFWGTTYTAKDQLRAFTTAIAAGANQNADNLNETVAAISRHDLQIFHAENWYPVKLKKSELNITAANNYKLDVDSMTFNSNPPILFDALKRVDFYAFPISADFVSAAYLYDRVLLPTFSLIENVDFVVDRADSVIIFTRNPFELEGAAVEPIYENGEIVDEAIALWAFKAKFDHQLLFKQFAYAINARLKSTENSKKFLNAIFDGLLAGGANAAVLDAALSAVFDVPLAKTDGEVVEIISLDNRGLFVATDKNVYRFAATAVPVVAVGDRLRAGDRIINAFEIVPLNRGVVPDNFEALALDRGFTAACMYGDLVFENKEVPLIVNENHPSGYTYVEFPLGGFPPDIRAFFDEMHARGIESLNIVVPEGCAPPPTRTGTLAHVLDLRTNPAGEPRADDLPATINPLKFIVENVLKNNTTLVIARISELGKNRLGLYNIRHMRQLLPPHMTLIFNYILTGETDFIEPEDLMRDDLNKFKGMEPAADTIPEALVNDRGVVVRVISGSCQ